MGFLFNRITVLAGYAAERWRHGRPPESDGGADQTLFMLDGVGGWFFGPLMMRRALRMAGLRMHTVLFDWHARPRGNMLADLMGLKRNRLMGVRLARRILALHRAEPQRKIHLAAYSGGCGVAVFALEKLPGPGVVDTAVLLAPALSPTYNLTAALRNVRRCVVGVSHRDRYLLGIGTRLFGTIDRVRISAAGRLGFHVPPGLPPEGVDAYARLEQQVWTPQWRQLGHGGGHTGWINPGFLSQGMVDVLKCPAPSRP